jgi:hypothetical protein
MPPSRKNGKLSAITANNLIINNIKTCLSFFPHGRCSLFSLFFDRPDALPLPSHARAHPLYE